MSKYENMLKKNSEPPDGKLWDRYGLSENEWRNLSVEQREIHYNRLERCNHPYAYPGVAGDLSNDLLQEPYSHDPYFHTAHMEPCQKPNECFCQMCANKIGLSRKQA